MEYNNQHLALQLYEAYKNKAPIECFKEKGIQFTDKEGYEIQAMVAQNKVDYLKEEVVGYKIGLTTKETQKLYNVDSPFYGTITNSDLLKESVQLNDFFKPFVIELELVFFIDEDLSINPSEEEVLSKTRIAPGLEMPDGRYINWTENKELSSIIADMGATGKVIYGNPVKYSSIDQLKDIKATLLFNNGKLDEGICSNALGNPINPLMWLINKLSERNQILKKGMIVSSGTVIMPKLLQKGTYVGQFEGVGNVTLEVK